MSIYKVKLKCITEFVGNIKANTLFGAFCYACSLRYNTNNIEEFIGDIVFSDLFHSDNTPIDIINNVTQYKKNTYSTIQKVDVTRTLIARDNDENNVINVLNGYYDKNFVNFYVYSKEMFHNDKKELEEIIKLMLRFGIGKWRNVGKGQFSIECIEDYEIEYLEKLSKARRLVALCDFQTSNKAEINNIKHIGYTIRQARATNGKEQEQLLLLKTGTTFNKLNVLDNQILTTSGNHIFDANSQTYVHSKTILLGV